MATVEFEIDHRFPEPPSAVWEELVDWAGHADWIPLTRVDVEPGDPTAVGARFTATTGIGPIALPDRMEVTRCDWNESSSEGSCDVRKLGPVLRGDAGFTVGPDGDGTILHWVERVTVPYTPQFLAPVLAWLGARGFSAGLRNLAKRMAEDSATRSA